MQLPCKSQEAPRDRLADLIECRYLRSRNVEEFTQALNLELRRGKRLQTTVERAAAMYPSSVDTATTSRLAWNVIGSFINDDSCPGETLAGIPPLCIFVYSQARPCMRGFVPSHTVVGRHIRTPIRGVHGRASSAELGH